MKRFTSIYNKFRRIKTSETVRLRAVVYPSESLYTIQLLEHDIVAQGDSIEEAMAVFYQLLDSWLKLDEELGREPLSALPSAPQKYYEMFERGKFIVRAEDEDEDDDFMHHPPPGIVTPPVLKLSHA